MLQVDCYTTNLSTSSLSDKNAVSYEISYSFDSTIFYLTDSVVFQGGKLCIGINLSMDNLKSTSIMLNVSSSSVVSGITNAF